MKRVLVLLCVMYLLSTPPLWPQQMFVPLSELVPKSDTIMIGIVVQRISPILRESDVRPLDEPVPNTSRVITQLPRLGNGLGYLYRVRVQEVVKQRAKSEPDRLHTGDTVNVFVPGSRFAVLDAINIPENETLMLILSNSTLKAEDYSDAVVWESNHSSEPYRRFDSNDCLMLTGGVASVISAEKEPDRVKEVKRIVAVMRLEVPQLISMLRDEDLRKNNREQVAEAIERLGNWQAVEAIDDLVKLLSFSRTVELESDSRATESPASDRYPALRALMAMEEKSLPALIEAIEENETNSIANKNARNLVTYIFRRNPSEGVKYLTHSAERSQSDTGTLRLRNAAEEQAKIARERETRTTNN